jgi:hypothetical protein
MSREMTMGRERVINWEYGYKVSDISPDLDKMTGVLRMQMMVIMTMSVITEG